MSQSHWTDFILPLLIGGFVAVPYVWCFIFRTLYIPLVCDWRCWIYVYGIVIIHAVLFVSILFRYRHGVLPWLKILSVIPVVLLNVLALIEQYTAHDKYIVPVIFLINLFLFSIWAPLAIITIYMCNRLYARLFEMGFLLVMTMYYFMLQYGVQESPAFWLPVPVLYVGGMYALLHFRTRPCFQHAIEKRHSIYYFGRNRYTVYTYDVLVRMASPEITLLIILVMQFAVGIPILAYQISVIKGIQYFYFLMLIGPLAGGCTFNSRLLAVILMILSCALMFILGLEPRWLLQSVKERLFIICLFLMTSAASCLQECMRVKVLKGINGVHFVYSVTVLYSIITSMILLTASS